MLLTPYVRCVDSVKRRPARAFQYSPAYKASIGCRPDERAASRVVSFAEPLLSSGRSSFGVPRTWGTVTRSWDFDELVEDLFRGFDDRWLGPRG